MAARSRSESIGLVHAFNHGVGQTVMKTTPRGRASWELGDHERFELRRRLGTGTFGAVFEVFDKDRGAKVALKLLKRFDAEDLYRFKHEFRALAGLTHPNIVRLYEVLASRDRWFFTMELVEGTDAVAFVRPGYAAAEAATLPAAPPGEGPPAAPLPGGVGFDELRLRSLLVQLAEGLSALHDAGTMHRDVKPSNVLVTREGRVVLVDFGLAVRLSSSGELSRATLVGTPAYLAPELIRGQPATTACDWYAVGVLLFEALTGQLPFTGSLQDVLSSKVLRDAPAPSSIADGLPPDLERLCVELLARDPAARPSGAELLSRLGGASEPRSGRRAIPFVGRMAKRAALRDLFDTVCRDRVAGVALMSGVAGIGKSALAARACADLREIAPTAVVLTGRCWEHESVPYKAIDGLIDPLSRHLKALPARAAERLLSPGTRALARLFPVLDQVEAIAQAPVAPLLAFDPEAQRRAAVNALRLMLARIAEERPLVLVIDDLQWGDADSAALLVELLAPPRPPAVLLVVSYRSEDVTTSACLAETLPALRALAGEEVRVVERKVDVLSGPEATDLAAALLPEALAGGEIAAAVAREAAGHPLFVRQLAERSAAAREAEGEVSFEALVRARLAELPPPAQRLLEIVAVAGRPLDRAAAARAAELGDDEPAAYAALRGAQLVRSHAGVEREEIEPYHERIGAAVAASLSADRRAGAVHRLAHALCGSRIEIRAPRARP